MRTYLYVVSCISLLAVSGLHGQTELSAGLMTISGSMSYQKNYYKGDERYSTFTLSPSVGRFLNNNIQTLIGLNFILYLPPSDQDWDSETYTFLTVGGRYYVPMEIGPLYGGVIYNYSRYSDSDEGSNSIDIQAGMLKFLSDRLALDIGLDYNLGLGDNKSSSITFGAAAVVFFRMP